MVRWYRKQRDQFREKYVWSRIKLDKNGDLRQLFTHKTLVDAFDALLVIPALLSEFKIEHDYLSLHCYEVGPSIVPSGAHTANFGQEYVYYLKGRVLKTWRDDICRGKERLMRSVDAEDVELVRLRAPAHSDKDLRDLKELFRERILFQAIENDSDRKEMWDGLRNVQNMILTLHTFFEDVKYLKHPAKAMMELISPLSQKEFRGTIYQSMQRIFDRTDTGNNVLIEETEGDFRKEQGSLRHRFQLGYRQLWLKPWRHWPELRGIGPQNESGEKPPIAPQRSTARWSEFASLAMKLGFRSPEISRHYTPDIAGEDGSARIDPPPLFVDGPGVILKQRCGPTSTEAYEADHPHLFYDTIHDLERGRGEDISSFFVRSSVYLSFFGWQTGNAKYFPFNEETDDGEFVPDESEPVRHRLPARVPEVGSHAPVTVDEPAPRDMPDAELPREISEILDIYHEPRTENPPGIEPSLDIPSSRHGDQDWQIASTAEAPGEQCWKDDESTLYDGSSDYERNSDYEGGTAYEGSVGDVREIDYGDCVGIPTEGDVIVSKEPSRSGVHAYQNPETSTPVGSPYFVIHWDGENVTRPRLPTLVDKNAVDSFAEREPGLLLTAHGRAMGPGQCGKAVEMDGTPAIVVAKGPKVVVSTLVIDKTRNLVRGAMTGWEDAMIEWNQSRKRQKVK